MTFTRAIEVATGDKITARQLIAFVRAINDRVLSGIGDGAWRLAAKWLNLFRLPRNPDSTGLVFPSLAEYFEVYQHLPNSLNYQWPVAPPGEFEGANLANVVMQYFFGVGSLPSEELRLSESTDENGNPTGVPLWPFFASPAQTLEDWWTLGKMQRGAIDPVSFEQAVPALAAAESIFKIVTPLYSPHGKTYGGFFPTPIELLSNCGFDPETDPGYGIPSYEIFFTGLRTDVSSEGFHGTVSTDGEGRPVITYAGTCPLGSEFTDAGHIVARADGPFATYVAVNDGAGGINVDRFDNSDWIEGPYQGASVIGRDADGQTLQRSAWAFATEFRGTASQRDPDDFDIEKIAFDFQAFSTRQYQLAPNRATWEGGDLVARYPTARLSGNTSAGEFLEFEGGGTQRDYEDGFVFSGYFAKATKLFAPARFEILDGAKVLQSFLLTPDAEGNASHLVYLKKAIAAPTLRVRTATAVNFSDPETGEVVIEATELLDYKPQWWDFVLLLRLAATRGGDEFSSGLDGAGADEENAKQIWLDYQRYGCIVNNHGAAGLRSTPTWVNDNPVYEAARKYSREQVRIVPRRQFHSYEVADGQSILRMYRYVRGVPGLADNVADIFDGLAPSTQAASKLVAGEEYIVRGTEGWVDYRGASFGPDQRFTAGNVTTFETHGDCQVYIYNGIREVALPKGWSNRWCMFLTTNFYHPSQSSSFKPESYADFFAMNQRCHAYSGSLNNGAFIRHSTYNPRPAVIERDDLSGYDIELGPERPQTDKIAVESPSGYNYIHGSNVSFGTPEFYQSCQIYKAPYEIESATIEFLDGVEIVKLVFKGRFQTHGDAPATVDPDASAWDSTTVTNLRDEDYRTDDNALREYARHLADPSYQGSWKIGDSGTPSSIQTLPDNPFGSIYPWFFFVKLLEEPFEDGNEDMEDHDSRAVFDTLFKGEAWLRAMCEGFVDGQTSLEITCQTGEGSLYDYRFKNLNFQAHGGASCGPFPLAVRDDAPHGFGPLPNTIMYADALTRQARCVNLLTRARVPLPFVTEVKVDNYIGHASVGSDWGDQLCSELNFKMAVSASPPAATEVVNLGDWGAGIGTAQSGSSIMAASPCCDGDHFILETTRSVVSWRVNLDPNHALAIPETWRDLVTSIGGFIARREIEKCKANATSESDSGLVDDCGPAPGYYFADEGGWKDLRCEVVESTNECILMSAGVLDPGTPLPGLFVQGKSGGDAGICGGSGSGTIIGLTVLSLNEFFVEIPLVDLP